MCEVDRAAEKGIGAVRVRVGLINNPLEGFHKMKMEDLRWHCYAAGGRP